MHKAVEQHTKYFRVDPVKYILLRRGAQWKQMLTKIAFFLSGLYFISNMEAKGSIESEDKHFIEGFFLLMSSYTIVTSSLYFLSYPLGERMSELPVFIAYTLLRILVSFLICSYICLYDGLKLEWQHIDSDQTSDKDYEKERL